MAGVGEAYSHVAALLFVLEGNTLLKQQFSCISLPCSWLPASLRSVPFAKMSKIDFTTPSQKRKITQMNESSSSDKCTEEPKKKKSAVSIPTDDELQTFYKELSKTDGQPVLLSLISGFNEAYIPASGMPKPLTDLYNPNGMKLSYPELLQS